MKLGRLPRGLSAALVALAALLVAPSSASAAPAAPAAYTVLARAYPLFWAGSSGLPVDDLKVPYVSGVTNNLPLTEARAALAQPDLSVTAMRGESIQGISCTGFDEGKCGDPFLPEAEVGHFSADAAHREQAASFQGREGKYPGSIHALTNCAGDCGNQLVRTLGEASGPAGGLGGYITIGGSSASHDTAIDSSGRLSGVARSQLRDAFIGPNGEIRFSSLSTTATATGLGATNSKDGRGDIRVENFLILDQPVELTSAGLRLASGAPSEQEAYDGAQALLEDLKKKGITLELPDFAAQVNRQPDFVTVKVKGLTVRFDQSVQGPPGVPAQAVSQVLDLGSSTALVAAFDREREITLNDGNATVQPGPEVQPPAAGPSPKGSQPGPATAVTVKPRPKVTPRPALPNNNTEIKVNAPAPPAPAPEPGQGIGPEVPPATDPELGPDQTAIGVGDVVDTLGLRGARSVSRAFGAFLGLGLILPLARFVIRRLG
ncbi:MAG: hypothetical protein M3357_06000 [Actinomycetota bacterium]|nr:hypothetical protein [Actinomycetota bacterium]